MSGVRTRFAPSPTGRLHVGNARTAVINWVVARHHGGEFVLRIEDTDVARNVAGAEADLMADLQWLGLDWDEGPAPGGGEERGGRGPYHQSLRGELYTRHAARLLEDGRAYRCFCSAEELEAARARALEEGRSPAYSGTCRALDPEECRRRTDEGASSVLRLATPAEGEVVVDDVIRGRVTFDAADIGDFVLVRSDGLPTYNFAVVVDDAAMEISHVVRDAGHLSNTPHQVLVYQALGLAPPKFAHIPTVLGPDRSKLSKRAGARSLASLREEGFHPDAVLNYLSLLGWSSPSGDEVLSRDRIVEDVTLDRMNAGDVVFDPDKMRWLSAQHIDRMPLDALADAVRPYVLTSPAAELVDERFPLVLDAVRSHLATFSQITDHLGPFLGPDPSSAPELDGGEREVVKAVRATLSELESWDPEPIQAAIRVAGKRADVRGRALYSPIRAVVTGEEHGPPLHMVLAVQGRDPVLERLGLAAGIAGESV